MEVLKAMPSWSWDEYKNALIRKGYTVHEREDKKGILRGYALMNEMCIRDSPAPARRNRPG